MENSQSSNANGAGKGDKPRNCFSKKYRDNYDSINWNKKRKEDDKNINNSFTVTDK
jgi:hypothetical protein